MPLSRLSSMRRAGPLIPAAAVAAFLFAVGWEQRAMIAAPVEDSARRPVLVELFTSEGCSSCPPADALLARLDQEQFVSGAHAIVLSEHVTYWNQDGWRDPFSSDDVTDRQKNYCTRFGIDTAYTPQAVIDGAAQVTGSDEAGLRRAIAQAADSPSIELVIQDAQLSGSSVRFKVTVGTGSAAQSPQAPSNAVLTAALAEDSVQIAVKSGENTGRTLRHVAVVRAMREMGKGALDGRDLTLKMPFGHPSGQMRLVVFLADRRSGRVLGAAERTLTQ